MIKGVIFDLGGVLLDNPGSGMRSFISKTLNITEKEFSLRSEPHFSEFQNGLISEKQFWQKVTNGLVLQEDFPKSLWREAIINSFSPKTEMMSLVEDLKYIGLKIGILSNTEVPVIKYLKEIEFDVFDILVYSCLEKTSKPEREIYTIIIERFGLKPYELVFIDDAIENIVTGQSMGLNCIHYESSDQVQVDLKNLIKRENNLDLL